MLVRVAAVGGDRQTLGVRVAPTPELLPPRADRIDRKLRPVCLRYLGLGRFFPRSLDRFTERRKRERVTEMELMN